MKPAAATLAVLAALLTPSRAADYQPRNTQAPNEHPPSPQEALAKITVPPGFQVTLFAAEPEVRQPVAMVTGDRGRIWVAESYSYKEWQQTGEDRVIILEDTDNDGVHDKRTVFWTGGNHVSGLNVGWGGVWVCSSPNLLFIPDRDGDDVPDGPPEVVLDGWTTKAGHNFFNGLTWGVDGWLYGRQGITAPSLVGKPGTPESERVPFDCAIWRYHPVTEKFEVVCRGTTNPWGMDWDERGELFFTNNVNGHLWHAVPGALFPRMGNRPDPNNVRYDYERMPMTADHLHHAGSIADWTRSRDGVGVHGDLGGGHSHCGGMIYLGDNWPEEYRGRIFMANTHGRRLNQNNLERHGSAYVGRRAPDLFFANQPWFRGVTVIYGPDGGVFVSDWTDLGECHDNDGVHRTSGRIFKVTYGKPALPREALGMLSNEDEMLAELHHHASEWFVRRARRVLQERKAANDDVGNAVRALRRTLAGSGAETVRIRALLTLHALDALDEDALLKLSRDSAEHVRKWSVRLAVDHGAPSPKLRTRLVEMAEGEKSGLVRLYLASALQKLKFDDRWQLAANLASRSEDAEDRFLPLMIWFGVKDAIAKKPLFGIEWLAACEMPQIHQFTARLACETAPGEEVFEALLGQIQRQSPFGEEIGSGMRQGLAGRRDLAKPRDWPRARSVLLDRRLVALADELDLLLDRDAKIDELRQRVGEGDARALSALIDAGAPKTGEQLLAALESETLRQTAIRGFSSVSHPKAAGVLARLFPKLTPDEQTDAIRALTSNKSNAAVLLDAIENGQIPRSALTAYQARQVHDFKDGALRKRLTKAWGNLKTSDAAKKAEIKRYQNQLLPDILAKADLTRGKAHFTQRCAACHVLHGQGGKIGPDLTGANRSNVYYLLENIIDPSATLPRDFHVTVVTKKDGQVLTGNLAKTTDYTLTLTTPEGDVVVNRADIKEQTTMPVSLMPEGLLNGLEVGDVRDLIAYLMK